MVTDLVERIVPLNFSEDPRKSIEIDAQNFTNFNNLGY